MSNIEDKVKDSMVDELIPGRKEELAEEKRAQYVNRRGSDHSWSDDVHDDNYWNRGGDDLPDGWVETKHGSKVKKNFYERLNKVEGLVGGQRQGDFFKKQPSEPAVRAARIMEEGGLVLKGDSFEISTLSLERLASVLSDDFADICDAAGLTWGDESGSKMRNYLRNFLLLETMGWDDENKNYLPLVEEGDDEETVSS